MYRTAAAALIALAVLACPSAAQSPEASQAQDLTNCAGAVAAYANIDVLAYPRGASGEWATVLGSIVARMNREPGIEGMTGRYAASAARSYWAERPRAEQEATALQCRTRFAS